VNETFCTWPLLCELRANLHARPESFFAVQDKLLRRAVAHVAASGLFHRRFWPERGFDPAGFPGLVASSCKNASVVEP
jgi:hypothetical protein